MTPTRYYMTMNRVAALLFFITTIVNAAEIGSTRIVDHAVGLDAIIITIPAELNQGFAVIDTPSRSPGDDIRDHWDPARHVFMINGGYFEIDFSPTGLCKIDGRSIGKTKSKKLSGSSRSTKKEF